MSYITQTEFELALTPNGFDTCFDDDGDGYAESDVIDSVIARASAMTDAWIAPVYKGPFPITQSPVPAMIRELTLQYARVFAFERRPDYAKTVSDASYSELWDRADKMGERLQAAVLRVPDFVAQPKPANVGGIIVDNARRRFVDDPDGTSNSGDFG